MAYLHLLLCSCALLHLPLSMGIPMNTTPVHVGVILDTGTLLGKLCRTTISMAIDDFYSIHDNCTTRLVIHTRDSEEDEAGAAWAALDLLSHAQVQAILGPLTSAQAELVADFGKKAQVPIVSFSATSPSLSPARKPYFIRTALHDAHQVKAVSSIVKYYGFRAVVPICEGVNHGAALLPYLMDALQEEGVHVPYRSLISPSVSDEQLEKELLKLLNMQITVFIVHMPAPLGSRLFLKAKKMGLMGYGSIWIITDSLTNFLDLLDPVVLHSMQGVLGLKPYQPNTEELQNFTARAIARFETENPGAKLRNIYIFGTWAYDAVWALARAVEKVSAEAQVSGNPAVKFSRRLHQVISNDRFSGKSGEIHMVEGQLQSSSFRIMNVAGGKQRTVGIWSPSHEKHLTSTMKEEKVMCPGDSISASRGWELLANGRKLKIAVPENLGFKELVNIELDPITNATLVTGYCIDIFDTVMKTLPYSVDYEYVPISSIENWTSFTFDGLVRGVLFKKYDAVVGDITILANRSFYVDFTIPYTETGVWMVVLTSKDGNTNRWIFVKPLGYDLWIGTVAFFCFTGFVVWGIERRINPEFSGSPREQLGIAFFFTFSTLVFAHRERLQSNLSRLVVIIWVFVVLILTTNYTANLTSMLTVEKLQPPTLADLLKNGDCVGHQSGSYVGKFLRELNFDLSKIRTYDHPGEYEDALSRGSQNGGVTAIFDEMPYIRVFLKERCSRYSIFGPFFDTRGFGFAFARGSTLVPDISRAIVNATDMKRLQPIEEKWLGDVTTCSSANRVFGSNKLTFKEFSGLFIISGVVSAACFLLSIGVYTRKNWDELRAVSSGNSLRRRVTEWVSHYFRTEYPRTSSAAAKVSDSSTAMADAAQGNQPDPKSLLAAPGFGVERSSIPVDQLACPPSAPHRSHHSSIELTTQVIP